MRGLYRKGTARYPASKICVKTWSYLAQIIMDQRLYLSTYIMKTKTEDIKPDKKCANNDTLIYNIALDGNFGSNNGF